MRPFSKNSSVAVALFSGLIIGGVGVGMFNDHYDRVDNVDTPSLKDSVVRMFDNNTRKQSILPLTPMGILGEIESEETDTEILYRITAPGVDSKTVKIDMDEDVILVTGERHEIQAEEEEGVVSERSYEQAFSRRFLIPEGVNREGVKVETKENEILVRFPKR